MTDDAFPPAQAAALESTRAAILRILPGATEGISWGMPTFRIDGDIVMSVTGFARHNSLFPGSAVVSDRLADDLTGYTVTKGTVHFDVDRPFPVGLLRRILRVRIEEINDSYPKKSGVTKGFYDNGRLRFTGRIRQGEMHGSWCWYRRDGSLLRTGEYRDGVKT